MSNAPRYVLAWVLGYFVFAYPLKFFESDFISYLFDGIFGLLIALIIYFATKEYERGSYLL